MWEYHFIIINNTEKAGFVMNIWTGTDNVGYTLKHPFAKRGAVDQNSIYLYYQEIPLYHINLKGDKTQNKHIA